MGVGDRRARLFKGEQRKLILDIAEKYGSMRYLAIKWDLPYSTIKNYASEICLLPENLFNKILKDLSRSKANIKVTYLDNYWGSSLGGKKGMASLEKKYPEKIGTWRKEGLASAIKKGKHWAYMNQKSIKIPRLDEDLAEFIGVYLGAGTMTKYQLKISGDHRYDLPYFDYLKKLVLSLFGLSCSIIKDKRSNTVNLIISSKNLCFFINKKFSIKFGHKIRNKTSIPYKILRNKKFAVACLRGLIDTDGSVSRRGRNGSQFCIQFTSHNKVLLDQVSTLGKGLGFFTFQDNTGCGTNKWVNIMKYFNIVGSSNLRHIVRFDQKNRKGNVFYQKDVIKYYRQDLYKGLNLPFKIGPIV